MAGGAFSQREVKAGRLSIRDADGSVLVMQGAAEGPRSAIRLHDETLLRKLMVKPDLFMGEGYVDGTLEIEEGTLYDFLEFCGINMAPQQIDSKLSMLFRRAEQKNAGDKARQNVAHHYDLDGGLYEHFLDEDRQYSCAYFASDTDSLEVAQANKKRHIAAKLLLEPGMKILDIGSGWGGLALYLARIADVEVHGVTLSQAQYEISRTRARAEGLDGRVTFELIDYREVDGSFERIVSVGMFEHVGAGNYVEFFGKIGELLSDDGVCLLHSIGRKEPPGLTHAWITKYIFPGGYSPSLSETLAAVEKSGMWTTDIEILRLHYADTLREWNKRFQRNRGKVKAIYDERFCRMWEFYLQSCEVGFRRMGWMVFQLQLAKSVGTVPITRDYIADFEAGNR